MGSLYEGGSEPWTTLSGPSGLPLSSTLVVSRTNPRPGCKMSMGYPLGILDVGLPSGDIPEVLGVDNRSSIVPSSEGSCLLTSQVEAIHPGKANIG